MTKQVYEKYWEQSDTIDEHGVLLDEQLNELRDEEGQIIIVPFEERENYVLYNKKNRTMVGRLRD